MRASASTSTSVILLDRTMEDGIRAQGFRVRIASLATDAGSIDVAVAASPSAIASR